MYRHNKLTKKIIMEKFMSKKNKRSSRKNISHRMLNIKKLRH